MGYDGHYTKSHSGEVVRILIKQRDYFCEIFPNNGTEEMAQWSRVLASLIGDPILFLAPTSISSRQLQLQEI